MFEYLPMKFSMMSYKELQDFGSTKGFPLSIDSLNQLRIARDEVSERIAELEGIIKEQTEIFAFFTNQINSIRKEQNSRKLPEVTDGSK
jgi:hypothetical protein